MHGRGIVYVYGGPLKDGLHRHVIVSQTGDAENLMS